MPVFQVPVFQVPVFQVPVFQVPVFQVRIAGTEAETINECESEPCANGATCKDELAAYLCRCVTGYTGLQCDKGTPTLAQYKLTGSNRIAIRLPCEGASMTPGLVSCPGLYQQVTLLTIH